jgi:hypothetical protein
MFWDEVIAVCLRGWGGREVLTLLRSSFLFRWRGRVCCFECSRVRRWGELPARTLCFGSKGEGSGFSERLGGWETITLLRAPFSSAGASFGEFGVLGARGFVAGATHPLARYVLGGSAGMVVCLRGWVVGRL